jgi:hypothetical protein
MNDIALIVCGALVREVLALKKIHDWQVDVLGVPSLLHNDPQRISPAVKRRINDARQKYSRVYVIYGDCGTSGELDQLLADEGVQRIAGPHCYEMYANGSFEKIMAEEPGTFFLTDYLVRSFDHLVLEGLGLVQNPQLRDEYFRNYSRVVYLVQNGDPALQAKAKWAAESIGLPLEIRRTGYGMLEKRLMELIEN